MQNFETTFKTYLNNIEVSLTEKFDRNFEEKGFFGNKWPQTKWPNSKGSLMARTNDLRNSIQKASIQGNNIVWRSHYPYATLHNQGCEITVTAKMIKFFWAMYYKAMGAITKTKKGAARATKRNQKMVAEAAIYKNLALMKIGTKIKIPQRQFIGNHAVVHAVIKKQTDALMAQIEVDLKTMFNPKK